MRGLRALALASLLAGCGPGAKEALPPPPAPDLLLFREAMAFQREGGCAQALAVLDRLVTTYPESPQIEAALFWLGFDQAETGDARKALASLGKLVSRAPNGPYADDALLKAYQIHVRGGTDADLAHALEDLEELLKRFPESPLGPDARLGLAHVLEGQGRIGEALAAYDALLSKAPPGADLTELKGWAEALRRELASQPRALEALLRGRHLLLRGQWKSALRTLEASLDAGARGWVRETALYYAGLAQAHALDWKGARDRFASLAESAQDPGVREGAAANAKLLSLWLSAAEGDAGS